MKQKLLISISALALIAGAGLATAQDKGGPGGGGSPSAAPQQSSPAQQSAPSGGGGEMKGGGDMKGGAGTQQRMDQPGQPRAQDQRNQRDNRAQEKADPKAGSTATDTKSDKKGGSTATDTKSDRKGGSTATDTKSDRKDGSTATDTKSDKKGGSTATDTKSRQDSTTGQGAAGSASGANLTTEQRTRITTTIKQSNVRPVTNVNFNISVGTVVPRSVTLHALPAAVIEVYPDWRPYRFVLVGDEILIIDPGTHRIIAVIDA